MHAKRDVSLSEYFSKKAPTLEKASWVGWISKKKEINEKDSEPSNRLILKCLTYLWNGFEIAILKIFYDWQLLLESFK